MNIFDVYPDQYDRLLKDKVEKIRQQFGTLKGMPKIEVFESPKEHYRMRAEFVIYHEGGQCHYVMFDDPVVQQTEEEEGQADDEVEESASKRARTEEPAGDPEEAEEAVQEVGTLAKPTTKAERKAAKRKERKLAKATGKRAPPTKVRVKITALPRAAKRINELMPQVLEAVNASDMLRKRLFQVNYLTTLQGDTLITLLYHKKLDEAWEKEAVALRDQLGVQSILGRAKKQVIQLDRNWVVEELTVQGRQIQQKQIEGSFTQPNAAICQHMLGWSLDVTASQASKERDLLELYCGNGNFALALAPNFRKALGTEISKVSVDAAQWNIAQNKAENIHIAAMSSQDFTAILKEGQSAAKLGDVDVTAFDFSTVLVDPPRAGLDEATCEMVQDYEAIVYVSCNPDTLRYNLETICNTHDIVRFAVFDQFPYTAHLECGAYLVRKPGAK